jgi:sugar phosphate isomerase/epimerase
MTDLSEIERRLEELEQSDRGSEIEDVRTHLQLAGEAIELLVWVVNELLDDDTEVSEDVDEALERTRELANELRLFTG